MTDADTHKELGDEGVDKGLRLAFGLASQQQGESILEAIERVTGTRSRISLAALFVKVRASMFF